MRPYPFESANSRIRTAPPLELTEGLPPPGGYEPPDDGDYNDYDEYPEGYTTNLPVAYRRSRWRWVMRGLAALVILFVIAVGWLAITAPLSKSLQPPLPPSVTLLADDGTPIARRGAIIDKPVDAAKLPDNVTNAFLAIEDRRFRSHWGIDPRGIARAMFHNLGAGGVREGGSTITQQLAKNAFLDSDRTYTRKGQEVLIAFWLEAWLSKDEILSRYLSNVYFGDNVYGLRAAAKHYFNRAPDKLNTGQAAMLAGLVKAPSRLAPTGNLKGARARQELVVGAMQDAGFISEDQADHVKPAKLATNSVKPLPDGTYFADWVLPAARDRAGEIVTNTTVITTLDRRLQKAAERAVRRAGLKKAQVALVAMQSDGRVVAMVGGKSYADSPFNRATQARRQPGSAFKLFVYLAAMRSGMTPDSVIEDTPVTIANWSPKNSDGRYEGNITLRRAFAKSSNVAAARLIQKVGVRKVIQAARDLGISTPIPHEASIALGTSTVSLLELTSAYASLAAEQYPVEARGIEQTQDRSWMDAITNRSHPLTGKIRDEMLDLLSASVETGTSRQAALSVDTFGKTGTTQDNRDALFLGFAKGLVVGVWVGNDDNSPNAGLHGGGIPARIWRDFMISALGVGPEVREVAPPIVYDPDALDDPEGLYDEGDPYLPDNLTLPPGTIPPGRQPLPLQGELQGLGLNLKVGEDGSIQINRTRDRSDRDADERQRRRDRSDEDDR